MEPEDETVHFHQTRKYTYHRRQENSGGILVAKKLLVDVVSSGKDVIFVGTKRQAQKAVETAAAKCGMHFVSGQMARWDTDQLQDDSCQDCKG